MTRAETSTPGVLGLARAIGPELVALRRELHRIPEIGNELPLTQRAVVRALDGLDVEVTTGRGLSSVVDVDFASAHPGGMHACGHDMHVAGLVGTARILLDRRDELDGDVVLMFQPGEEGPGAPSRCSRRACSTSPAVRSSPPTRCTSRRRSTPAASGSRGPVRSRQLPTRCGCG